ncbi:hypothetical protein KJ966_02475 [bacterium]|nr:hypothetical protein [bacterium]
MKKSSIPNKEIEIDGIVVPNSWSPRNRVITIAVNTAGEHEYLIDSCNKKGKELKKLLGKRVKIKGQLSQVSSLPMGLIVDSYQVYDW